MKKVLSRLIICALVFTLSGGLLGCDGFSGGVIYESREAYVFNTDMKMSLLSYGKNFDRAFEQMLDIAEEIDLATNINREGSSDVLRINLAGAGEEVEISFYVFDMINLSKDAYESTDGAFNVAAYPLVYLWAIDALGYEDSVAALKSGLPYDKWRTPQSFVGSDIKRTLPLPDYVEVQRVKAFCDLDLLRVFEREGKYFAVKDDAQLMIDLGGIAKGYAADLCADVCRANGLTSALIDIAGNIVLVGEYEGDDAERWQIGVTNPSGGYFCVYGAEADSTAVTSGDYIRFRRATSGGNNIEICHIINTATGLPYGLTFDGENFVTDSSRVAGVSVLSGKSALAEVYSTAACVLGAENAVDLFENSGVDAIIITADGRYAVTGEVLFVLTSKYDAYKSFEKIN